MVESWVAAGDGFKRCLRNFLEGLQQVTERSRKDWEKVGREFWSYSRQSIRRGPRGGYARSCLLILAEHIFSAKHYGMGNKKANVWQQVPWGWVLVSVYCTALACVGVSQLASQDAAAAFVKDYQTLIAGVATVAALFIAAQQLKRQANRDAVDAQRHYQAEIDALRELQQAATRLATIAEQTPAPYDAGLPYERARWDRLRNQVHHSVASSVYSVMKETETYNGLVERAEEPAFPLSIGFGPDLQKQYREERTRVYIASLLLLAAIQERRGAVLLEIEATS